MKESVCDTWLPNGNQWWEKRIYESFGKKGDVEQHIVPVSSNHSPTIKQRRCCLWCHWSITILVSIFIDEKTIVVHDKSWYKKSKGFAEKYKFKKLVKCWEGASL